MDDAPFELRLPERQTTGVVFASPHSGRAYPPALLRRSVLDDVAIRSSEDAYVDELFEAAPMFGAPFLCAVAPRAWVDLNRAADELDPALIDGARRIAPNPRISSGLGVIPRVVAGGRSIYRGKLSLDEARERVRDVWRPYHDTLHGLLIDARLAFGRTILVDCHSMPHEAVEGLSRDGRCPDVVLGDRFGAAAAADVVEGVEAAFAAAGLTVSRNAPFAGAYITQHYGRPARNQHVVQVEIDRALYMDEATLRPTAGFAPLQAALRQVVREIAELGRPALPLAAE
ncbi:N-formylglutamate amidohydrolase [Rhodobacteraceae bacterium CCMM004]|nr:N-formylglutamate amidohydrolase [Rhodobacteraceae bacterium CCMM004]